MFANCIKNKKGSLTFVLMTQKFHVVIIILSRINQTRAKGTALAFPEPGRKFQNTYLGFNLISAKCIELFGT